MARRRPPTKSPHWKMNLDQGWKAMRRARLIVRKSGLEVNREIFEEKRRSFERENRRRRSFAKENRSDAGKMSQQQFS